MPQLLLELFCEEIPARMQAKAERDLADALQKSLKDAGLGFGKVESLSGPRRLTVIIDDVAARSDDVREERKGPKVGAPDKAVQGFIRGAGLSSIDDAEVRSDPKKGEFYVAVIETPGRNASDIIAEAVPAIVRGFHWPKSMRWGEGELRWVRPLQRILCLLDGKIVPFDVDSIESGNVTEGHRVMGRGPFEIESAEAYKTTLEKEGHVVLNRETRKTQIHRDALKVCVDAGLELIEDIGLLEEVTGLAEYPVVLLGEMDPAFLDLPEEVIQLSMKTHQKYFAVRDPKSGKLAPNFVVVANLKATDGGKKIAAGNARVLSARLNDGRFFWDNDLATPLEEMGKKLSTIAFKAELGSIGDKVERVAALARELAPKVGADPDLAEKAARLCKADLVSEMVYEFPELQGVMGRYYALEAGEPTSVADAIRDHYRPQGPSDVVPTDPVSVTVALADKLDTLVGFWAIDEKPTGSKDPFALRRAALGVVRLVLENGVRLSLCSELFTHYNQIAYQMVGRKRFVADGHPSEKSIGVWDFTQGAETWRDNVPKYIFYEDFVEILESREVLIYDPDRMPEGVHGPLADFFEVFEPAGSVMPDLLSFFADRLKQVMKDQGKRHDLIDAVFALGQPQAAEGDGLPAGQAAPAEARRAASDTNDDLVLIVKRVEALSDFLATEDGANLLAGYKRASNILKAEEKKDKVAYDGAVIDELLSQPEERALSDALKRGGSAAHEALGREDFTGAMAAMSKLRGPIDAFFDRVTVNAEDGEVRKNRLYLLAEVRSVLGQVADFTKIEG